MTGLNGSLHGLWSRVKTGLGAKDAPRGGFTHAPGLYHYTLQTPEERSRVHLRIDPDPKGKGASGMLMVNASRVMHLNPTAALMAHLALENASPAMAVRQMQKFYRVSSQQAGQDYAYFNQQLSELLRPDGACPIHELDLETTIPFSAQLTAPYRMDLAITYRCNDNCAHCYNARPRNFAELPTADWLRIIDRLWEVGIPHIVFTGGEPTLRKDLPELIAHAERNGQITGLNTNGRLLSDPVLLGSLVDAGLDHVQITVESHDPAIHDGMVRAKGAWKQTIDGVRSALKTRLYVMTNTTLLEDNSPSLGKTLDFLTALGVPTIGLNALIYSGRGLKVGKGLPESALPPLLEMARTHTALTGQKLIWYTPTQYCNFDPMLLELGVKGCTAALYNMCLEPNGDVLPCQSYYTPIGNLLSDPWEAIWNHDLAVSLRERRYVPQKCQTCALLIECGGGCPLSLAAAELLDTEGFQEVGA